MASTQYDLIVAMQLQNSGVARQAQQQVQEILNEYAKLSQANIGGPLSQQSIDQFQSRLKAALKGAFEGSDINSLLRRSDQKLVTSTTSTPTTPLLAQQLRLVQAELAAAQVAARSRVPLGTSITNAAGEKVTGYSSENARTQARVSAAAAVERANQALENAIVKQIREAEKAAGSDRRKEEARAREIQAINKRTRGDEEARAREIQALNKRQAQQEAADRRRQQALAREILAIEARARADQKIADRDAAAQAGDRAAAAFQPTYANPDGATPLGRAQAGVNAAERALEIATIQAAEAHSAEGRTTATLLAADRRLESATVAAAAARERVAVEQRRTAGAGSGGGGIGSQFLAGFRGGGDNPKPYAEQIGQAFKFSVFYGTAYKLLFGITQTFQQTLQEGIEFQTAVSELRLVTEGAVDDTKQSLDALSKRLGDRATSAGFAPSEGVLAGARGIGLYGATQASSAEQSRIADISARVATRVAFNSGMQTQDVQTNIAAITNAFGTGAEGQFQVADLDAYFARRFGVAPGGTIQAVAESANVGQAAGFDQEQINAIAALLQGRTGQTATTVAGYMAQIFSRGGEGSLTAVGQRYGIDPTENLAEQIKQLAAIYNKAAPNEQTAIASSFGRGKVQNAITVLLSGFDEVQSASAAVRGGAATGASDKAFEIRIGNLGGQIQLTVATMKEFANALGQSGLLDVIGAGIVVFREIVDAATGLLRVFDELPGPLKALAAAALAAAVAQRLGASTSALVGRLGTAGVIPASVASRFGPGALSGAGGAGIAGALINPTTAAVAGLLAIGAFKQKADALGEAFDTANEALSQGLDANATPDQINARVAALRSGAKDTRDASDGTFGSLINIGSRLFGGQSDQQRNNAAADQLDREADRLARLAEAQQSALAGSSPQTALIQGFDAETLSSSFDAINASGGNARDRMEALSASLLGTAEAASRAQASFDPANFAANNAQGIFSAIQGSANVGRSSPGLGRIAAGVLIPGLDVNAGNSYENVLPDLVNKYLTRSDVEERLQAQLAGVSDLGTLSPEKISSIATAVVGDTPRQIGKDAGLDDSGIAKVREFMIDDVTKYLTGQVKGVQEILNNDFRLTNEELTNVTGEILSNLQGELGDRADVDFSGKLGDIRGAIRDIKAAIAATPGGEDNSQAQDGLADLNKQLAQTEFARFEALRKRAQQLAGSKAEVAAVGNRYLRREIASAVRGGDADLLAQIVGQAGTGAIAIARAAIREALQVARAARALQAAAAVASGSIDAEGFVRGGQSVNTTGSDGLIDNLNAMKSSLNTAVTAGKGGGVYATGSDVPGAGGVPTGETAGQQRAAAAEAAAIRSQSPIAQARASVISARNAMAEAEKGSVAYYNALGQYYQARQSLTDAILDYKANRYLLGIDLTDPVAQARVALRVAQDKLRSDAGAGADVRAEDKIAVRNAQNELEASRFSQRLETVQTADDLGRISHQKYLAYLDHEHDRLSAVKNRTYQQQSQLDQIDKLMKEAATAMNSQWNFGDIKLPTPYQVRRRVEELSQQAQSGNADLLGGGPGNARSAVASTVNNFDINGADTGAVMRLLREAIGQTGRTTSGSRKTRR